MIANARLFWVLAGFFFLVFVTYVIWGFVYDAQGLATQPAGGQGAGGGGPIEWVGTVGLLLVTILAALIAFFIGRTHAAQGGELPEDRLDANIDDGDAEQGFFSPWSWWPLMLGGSAALLFLGIVVGTWIAYIAAALTLVSLVGWTFEYYRGNFER